ncbi:uncharacterized protein LOC142160730 isoform X2 [Mixophyes fleayi]
MAPKRRSSETDQQVIIRGSLLKSPPSYLFKKQTSWKRRLFKLCKTLTDSYIISYYHYDGLTEKWKGDIYVGDIKAVELGTNTIDKNISAITRHFNTSSDNVLYIKTEDRTYFLLDDNVDTIAEWQRCITDVWVQINQRNSVTGPRISHAVPLQSMINKEEGARRKSYPEERSSNKQSLDDGRQRSHTDPQTQTVSQTNFGDDREKFPRNPVDQPDGNQDQKRSLTHSEHVPDWTPLITEIRRVSITSSDQQDPVSSRQSDDNTDGASDSGTESDDVYEIPISMRSKHESLDSADQEDSDSSEENIYETMHRVSLLEMEYDCNVEFMTDFIETYRAHPCLWKIKSKEYSNSQMCNVAMQELVKTCLPHYPGANLQWAKGIMQNLQTVFKKELNNIEASEKSGAAAEDVYVPKLWYFDLLPFIRENEITRQSTCSLHTDSSSSTDDVQSDDLPPSGTGSRVTVDSQDVTEVATQPQSVQKKRKKMVHELEQSDGLTEKMVKCTNSAKEPPQHTFDLLAATLASKMNSASRPIQIQMERLVCDLLCRATAEDLCPDTILTPSNHREEKCCPAKPPRNSRTTEPHRYRKTQGSQLKKAFILKMWYEQDNQCDLEKINITIPTEHLKKYLGLQEAGERLCVSKWKGPAEIGCVFHHGDHIDAFNSIRLGSKDLFFQMLNNYIEAEVNLVLFRNKKADIFHVEGCSCDMSLSAL